MRQRQSIVVWAMMLTIVATAVRSRFYRLGASSSQVDEIATLFEEQEPIRPIGHPA